MDPDELKGRFYALSRQWHPDRFVAKTEAEQQLALDNTALLNDAIRTLRDPVARAEYVLAGKGLAISGQGTKDVPPDLLEEALELNMALEDADASEIERLGKQYDGMLAAIDGDLDGLFAEHDSTDPDERDGVLGRIRQLLNRRKYISNLSNKIGKVQQTFSTN